jgi:hypothetical protein
MSQTLYREWLIFLGCLFSGLFILPLILAAVLTDAINLSDFYYTLFGGRQASLSWGFVLLPYAVLWSGRLFFRISGFKTLFPAFPWQQSWGKS